MAGCTSCSQAAMYPMGYARAPEFRGMTKLGALDYEDPAVRLGLAALATAGAAASAYHGYKRNKSVGWALVWAFFGGLAPVLTPVIAVAQGYGKPAK